MRRRDILNLAVSSTMGSAMLTGLQHSDAGPYRAVSDIIDTNVSLFRWPFRRLPLDEPHCLVQRIRDLGVSRALTGTFESILHRDISSANRRLALECQKWPELIPVGAINPTLPDWKSDLLQCRNEFRMAGIRLWPNYHRYQLDSEVFVRLLRTATELGLFIQIVSAMEDERTQHPELRASDVDLLPMTRVLPTIPRARVQILNARPGKTQIQQFSGVSGIFFDTARVDSTDGVPNLVAGLPEGRVMFGSHAPFLIPEAALIRVHESSLLDATALRRVLSENAAQLIGARSK